MNVYQQILSAVNTRHCKLLYASDIAKPIFLKMANKQRSRDRVWSVLVLTLAA